MLKYFLAKLRCQRGEVGGGSAASTQSPEGQTQKAKLEGLISDIDFSDVPEDIRQSVIDKVSAKVKSYDAGFRSKTEEVKALKEQLKEQEFNLRDLLKLRDEIQGNPELEKAVTSLINDYRAGKKVSKTDVDKSQKLMDQLIQQTDDPATREQLRQLRQVIKEESNKGLSQEDFDKLQAKINSLEKSLLAGLGGTLDSGLADLEQKYGKEIVDKYRNDIKALAQKHPEYLSREKIGRLLFHCADEEELSKALLDAAEKRKLAELRRKEDGTFPGGTTKVAPIDPPKDKAGRVIWSEYFAKMKSSGAFK